ncbi:MAG: NADH-quinone oxidoreductase subunit NuoE [Bacteroidales bacterium]|nr:NADH-quinone oxidoreductase subunit NuoE [Bacteroidales bacterium]
MRITRLNTDIIEIEQEKADLLSIDPLIEKYRNKKGNMIPILQGIQEIFGYIPRDAFDKVSDETGLELSDMYGVATFYSQFRLNPVGKHIIKVCHGTACHVQNANALTDALQDALKINDGETTEDGLFTLESVACLGCCSLAPVMMIGEETYGKLTGDKAKKIIRDIKRQEAN